MSNAYDKKQMPWESQDTRVEVQQVQTRRPTALWVAVVVLAVAQQESQARDEQASGAK